MELKESLATGKKVETETKYFVLPTKEAYGSYHPTSGPAGFSLRVHPKIIERINTLVGEGIMEVQEVKHALRHYQGLIDSKEKKASNCNISLYT